MWKKLNDTILGMEIWTDDELSPDDVFLVLKRRWYKLGAIKIEITRDVDGPKVYVDGKFCYKVGHPAVIEEMHLKALFSELVIENVEIVVK